MNKNTLKQLLVRYFFTLGVTTLLFVLLSLLPRVKHDVLFSGLRKFALWSFFTQLAATGLFSDRYSRSSLWLRRVAVILIGTLSFIAIYAGGSGKVTVILVVALIYAVTCALAFMLADIAERRKLERLNRALEEKSRKDK